MTRSLLRGLGLVLLLLSCRSVVNGFPPESAVEAAQGEEKLQFQVIPLQHTSSGTVADHLGGLVGSVEIVADVQTNTVILRGQADDLKTAEALIQLLDRQSTSAQMEFEFVMAELSGETQDLNAAELLRQARSDAARQSKTFKLIAIENQQAMFQSGGTENVRSGATSSDPRFGGRTSRSAISVHSVGTIITVQARQSEDRVVVAYDFQMTWLEEADAGNDSGPDQKTATVTAQSTFVASFDEPIVLASREQVDESGKSRLVLLAIARKGVNSPAQPARQQFNRGRGGFGGGRGR